MNKKKQDCEKINVPPDIVIKAEEGDHIAQLELGKAYYNLTSIENHDIIAFDWINRSAEQGNMEAQFKLGDFYALGYGTEKSLSDSYKWYTQSAIQGNKKALIRIHNLYKQDTMMHCRGQLNSGEEEWTDERFKKENKIRELYEYRLEQNKTILNGAIDYYTQKFKCYQSSDQKDPVVQLNLAFLYQHGYGINKWMRWAFEYYSLAAEQGNVDAQYNLGHLYQGYSSKKFNYRDAFQWYTKSAQGGSISAQRCLAYFYLKGLATDINYDEAIYWYTKASEAGDSQAQVTLGMLYRKGDYIQQDLAMAVKWYTLAARQGNTVAKNCLSQLHRCNRLIRIELDKDMLEYLTEESMNKRLCSKLSMDISKLEDSLEFKQLNKIAKHALIGDGPAMFEIGLRYFHGDKDFPQDQDSGIKWIKHAATKKHKAAQFLMATLYKNGGSIDQDYYKSCIWYKAMARYKDDGAQYQVGSMYYKGLGVREDPLEASKWLTWAADQENSDAQFMLGMFRALGTGIKKDQVEAESWLYKSVRQKHPQSCYEVGCLYISGFVVEKDFDLGLRFLNFAANHDDSDAQLFLGDLYKYDDDVQHDLQRSIGFYTKAANSGDGRAQYELGISYLSGDSTDQEYIEAYNLLNQARNRGDAFARNLFKIPFEDNRHSVDHHGVINMFTKVTEKGIDNFAYNIGFIYEKSIYSYVGVQHIRKDYTKAKEWYLIASNKNDSRADYRLGMMHENGEYYEPDLETAIYHYKNAVEKGNSDAMYRLACIYLEYDLFENPLEAFLLFTKASTMEYKKATKALSILDHDDDLYNSYYSDGDAEIPLDRNKLIIMLEKATEKGYTQLQYQLGIMYDRNYDYLNAFKWLQISADLGITDAYYRLGVMYEEGRGIEQSFTMAENMYQQAAINDHENAFFRLGQLYQYGNGVEIDYLKAYSFYKKAAEMHNDMAAKVLDITLERQIYTDESMNEYLFGFVSEEYQDSLTMHKYVAEHGDTEVQFKVGFAFENNYFEPDYREVFRWYLMATKGSHREAIYHLGLLYENGLGVSRDYNKAIALYGQAFQLGSYDALHRLGIAYHYGRGVEIDHVKAIECYILSAEHGNPEYQCTLGLLYEEGELVQKCLLTALKWYTKAYLKGYDNIGSKLYDMYEDKPYEDFFFEKLLHNLSIASRNCSGLDEYYEYKYFGALNNQLGLMYFFGIGTEKNLAQSLQYFLKEYSGYKRQSVNGFSFFMDVSFSSIQKINILSEYSKDEECMNQLDPNHLYILGMVYYDGIVHTDYINYKNEIKGYTPIDEQDLNDPSQYVVIEKDYVEAMKYFKKAAENGHAESFFQIGIMYHFGYGVEKNNDRGEEYFDLVPHANIELLMTMATLYHTQNGMQNFYKAFEYYNVLKNRPAKTTEKYTVEEYEIDALIQQGLGLLYEYGDGVEQDYQKALQYYQELANVNNNPIGCLQLGLMYYNGKGVPVDYEKALDSFTKSAGAYVDKIKVPYVHYFLEKRVYSTKTSLEIEGERYYYMSLIYKQGQGITKDEGQAQFYFQSALIYGFKHAEE